jgi:phage baseplate assembly protein W
MATLQKIYSDIDLTFNRLPVTNDIALRYNDQSVIASVRNLLLTNFYERPFQPSLGSNIDAILFEQSDGITSNILENEIRNVIKNFEPRVTINQIIIQPDLDNNSFNLTMSFFIGNNTTPTTVNMLLQRSR